MESTISLQDVANIVIFIAPGYFAMQVYVLANTKRDRDFSRLFIESVIYSLPIVTLANLIWAKVLGQPPVTGLDTGYALLVLTLAILAGALVVFLRIHWPAKQLAERWGFGPPHEDFIKTQLLRLYTSNSKLSAVTVRLKSGGVFSGTVDRLSRYSYDGPNYYCFTNLAWLDEKTGKWEEREGSLLLNREEIEYIETQRLRKD